MILKLKKFLLGVHLAMVSIPLLVASNAQASDWVELVPIQGLTLELPDQQYLKFGEFFELSLVKRLKEGNRFEVIQNRNDLAQKTWAPILNPAVRIQIEPEILSFQTGFRGDRTTYGFDDRIKNIYNNGKDVEQGGRANEFPIFQNAEASHFGSSFRREGVAPFDNYSGLDLGQGFRFNALIIKANAQYARYQAWAKIKVKISTPWPEWNQTFSVGTTTSGFFLDFSGGYKQWGAGIRLARRDAMEKSLEQVLDQTAAELSIRLAGLPTYGNIVANENSEDGSNGKRFLVRFSNLKSFIDSKADLAKSLENRGHYQVYPASNPIDFKSPVPPLGSLKIESIYSESDLSVWMTPVKSEFPEPHHPIDFPIRSLVLLSDAKAKAGLNKLGQSTEQNFLFKQATPRNIINSKVWEMAQSSGDSLADWFRDLLNTVFLPYRIVRYFQTDRDYSEDPDGVAWTDPEETHYSPKKVDHSAKYTQRQWISEWKKLDINAQFFDPKLNRFSKSLLEPELEQSHENRIRVAVLDSGLDYNHPVLRPYIASVQDSTRDFKGEWDTHGWDFASGDSRPYDDTGHGTAVASSIIAGGANIELLPVKVINPFGQTHSAAVLAGFEYALSKGSKIIVCAWSVDHVSEAVNQGIRKALEQGVWVVTPKSSYVEEFLSYPRFVAVDSEKIKQLSLDPSRAKIPTYIPVAKQMQAVTQILRQQEETKNRDAWVGWAAGRLSEIASF